MISHRATLDVPKETLEFLSHALDAHRTQVDTRPWQRAATPYEQAVMVLRWFRAGTNIAALARDAGISQATGYRYLHEVLEHGIAVGWEFLCLDGTLIESTRTGKCSDAGHDLWYSGKHYRHGGNIQVLADPAGFPRVGLGRGAGLRPCHHRRP